MQMPVTSPSVPLSPATGWNESDFSTILSAHGAGFEAADNYWRVGALKQVQGWILDLSFTLYDLPAGLEAVVPILLVDNIAFQVIADMQTATDFVHGYVGIEKIGKMVSVFCPDDRKANQLAAELIAATSRFNGPAVLTDRYLGGTVYARYGAFEPVMVETKAGRKEPHIYMPDLTLVPDTEQIPFQLPAWVRWPFERLAAAEPPKPKKVLNHFYRPVVLLKEDVRGNVYKGLYLKSLLRVKDCVIKQGKKGMTSDIYGREMHHRLAWQCALHRAMEGIVPLPKIYDLFVVEGDTYLAMEYINGKALYDRVKEINHQGASWQGLESAQRLAILGYIREIVFLVGEFHKQGFVHRDVHPGNFMVDKQDRLVLIDIELAYSVREQQPEPPFTYGTAGFMSPEQQDILAPTFKEDIYGIGATMVNLMTGVSPSKLEFAGKGQLSEALALMIGDPVMEEMVIRCLDRAPGRRPEIAEILSVLEASLAALKSGPKIASEKNEIDTALETQVRTALNKALRGLAEEPVIISEGLWYFKMVKEGNFGVPQMREYTKYPGLRNGMAGVLLAIAKALQAGLSIEYLVPNCLKARDYLETFLTNSTEVSNAGYYDGKAGIAVAIAEAIKNGLVPDGAKNRGLIYTALSSSGGETGGLHYGDGLAGIGMAVLYCHQYLEKDYSTRRLTEITSILLSTQNREGLWERSGRPKKDAGKISLGFGQGDCGLIWYLLHSYSLSGNKAERNALERTVPKLLKAAGGITETAMGTYLEKNTNGLILGDELPGMLHTMIKMSEVLGKHECRAAAEQVLRLLPDRFTNNNFTAWNGLAALGEAYLSAWHVFGNHEWRQRATWIAALYAHLHGNNPHGYAFWMTDESDAPTASFMNGNSGIIHFLARYLSGGRGFY
ncbi:MAG: protein kinase [Sphingobacteriales bacterium]|nr:protein kinase [Sphingobacteriales bacterium]